MKVIKLFDKLKKSITINQISESIYLHLDELIGEIKENTSNNIDLVLLENQPSKGVMKTVQMLIYGFFYNLKHYDNYVLDIVQVNASIKLEGYEMDKHVVKQNNIEIIKKSIEICTNLIKGNNRLEEIMLQYKSKKDDLCDSLLQIIGYKKKEYL